MKHLLAIIGLASLGVPLFAQQGDDKFFNPKEVERIERALSSDGMAGRQTFGTGIEKAADFIASEFKSAGLSTLTGATGFRQSFEMLSTVKKDVSGELNGLSNIVGVLPGKTKKDEYVIFSGHYDHLGIGRPVDGDSIYNGANDDATGITAVIMLARYFKHLANNERTLVFAAFTAEEIGGLGSRYFSQQMDPSKVMAMFNIEMIGTDSKWGKNSAYITGYDKTDMGEMLRKNLKGTPFNFYPDPYISQDLFYRSDNATLARQGVAAHTISTFKADSEKFYHTVDDEIETLDLNNMAMIIKAIAKSSMSIVNGSDKPSRVNTANLR